MPKKNSTTTNKDGDLKENNNRKQKFNIIGTNIRMMRTSKGLSLSGLSKLCGWGANHVRIGNYERAKREPEYEDMLIIANALNERIDWFYADHTYEQANKAPYKYIPLVSTSHLANEEDFTNTFLKTIPVEDFGFGEKVFAWINEGCSMMPEFLDGTLLIVDPQKTAKIGDYVIANLERQRGPTFKKLEIDGGRKFLVPLNSQFPPIEISDKTKIIGVVVAQLYSKQY